VRNVMLVTVCAAFALFACKRESRSPLSDAAKACTEDGEVSCPRPIFNVHDLARSTSYYRDALGFKIDWVYGEPPSFGSVSRGHAVFFLCQGCQGVPGAWAMAFTPDVDRLHDELRRRKAIIRMPPTTMPWHVREMHVADPDGNVLRFGTGIDDD
jgi:catechol 2,3-dioxygenase-like lactoylglutathione lyase family enzyme